MKVIYLNSGNPFVSNVSGHIILPRSLIKKDEAVFVHFEVSTWRLDSEWNVLVKNAYVTAKEYLTKATAVRR